MGEAARANNSYTPGPDAGSKMRPVSAPLLLPFRIREAPAEPVDPLSIGTTSTLSTGMPVRALT